MKRLIALIFALMPLTMMAAPDAEATIMDSVYALSLLQQDKEWHYESTFYFRGILRKTRHNIAFLLLPNIRFYRSGGRTLLTESYGVQHHDEPESFARKTYYTYGSTPDVQMTHSYIMDFFCLTPYEDFLLKDHILSPLSPRARHYYHYHVEERNGSEVTVMFRALHHNCQLVTGSFIYDKEKRYVKRIRFSGAYGFAMFKADVIMGTQGELRYWPQRSELIFSYSYLGNHFAGKALFMQTYTSITPKSRIAGEKGSDMSMFMPLQRDTTRMRIDKGFFDRYRPEPLTMEERDVYEERNRQQHRAMQKAAVQDSVQGRHRTPQWIRNIGHLGEYIFHSYDFNTSDNSNFEISTPDFSYSGWRGVTYRQGGCFQLNVDEERQLNVRPKIGYYLKPYMFVWEMNSDYRYSMTDDAHVDFNLSQRGMYGSPLRLSSYRKSEAFVEGEEQDRDTSFLFRDLEARLEHRHELFNGFHLTGGLSYHYRMQHHMNDSVSRYWGVHKAYSSLAIRMNIRYTPCQQYYRIANKKYPLASRWPTFVLDYERGIRGTLVNSKSHYERWECMANSEFHLTPIHTVLWKLGAGMFTNRHNVDFVSYEYFNNGITDYSWRDDVGGVFHLLDGKFYNDSYHYLRGHVVVESPMLLLGRFNTYYLRSERLYLSALATDGLTPYLELGYGVSTHLVDVSAFASYNKHSKPKFGMKFTLHIFD